MIIRAKILDTMNTYRDYCAEGELMNYRSSFVHFLCVYFFTSTYDNHRAEQNELDSAVAIFDYNKDR